MLSVSKSWKRVNSSCGSFSTVATVVLTESCYCESKTKTTYSCSNLDLK
ncbi:unnamed protein product [Acanthoscelides obtectus]|uniref:Uncharacterized protein n=1 Tax=Acanthoscelides obtectus TaxID=200917 RepID=A0A9P0MAQ1_ACAOB|nr:unnamed protein product [Acanthoscelides obtectus]CAK1630007.1 hypothetical protein AOBTE_LOCUS6096 [Acanthoscelides obtectus]